MGHSERDGVWIIPTLAAGKQSFHKRGIHVHAIAYPVYRIGIPATGKAYPQALFAEKIAAEIPVAAIAHDEYDHATFQFAGQP